MTDVGPRVKQRAANERLVGLLIEERDLATLFRKIGQDPEVAEVANRILFKTTGGEEGLQQAHARRELAEQIGEVGIHTLKFFYIRRLDHPPTGSMGNLWQHLRSTGYKDYLDSDRGPFGGAWPVIKLLQKEGLIERRTADPMDTITVKGMQVLRAAGEARM